MKIVTSISYILAASIQKVELLRWFLLLVITLTILIFSVLRNTFVMQTIVGSMDKLAHLIIFLGYFLVTKFLIKNLSLFKISLITFSLGLLIELLQAWFTHGKRKFDLFDIVFNLLGIVLGLLLLLIFRSGATEKK